MVHNNFANFDITVDISTINRSSGSLTKYLSLKFNGCAFMKTVKNTLLAAINKEILQHGNIPNKCPVLGVKYSKF